MSWTVCIGGIYKYNTNYVYGTTKNDYKTYCSKYEEY